MTALLHQPLSSTTGLGYFSHCQVGSEQMPQAISLRLLINTCNKMYTDSRARTKAVDYPVAATRPAVFEKNSAVMERVQSIQQGIAKDRGRMHNIIVHSQGACVQNRCYELQRCPVTVVASPYQLQTQGLLGLIQRSKLQSRTSIDYLSVSSNSATVVTPVGRPKIPD